MGIHGWLPLGMEGAQENSAVVVSDIWACSGPDFCQGLREGGQWPRELNSATLPRTRTCVGQVVGGCHLLGSCLGLAI